MVSYYPDQQYGCGELYFVNEENVIADIKTHLDKACVLAQIDQDEIKCVLELGPGYGRATRALLATFPNATIQAIDIRDQLGGGKG